jgi:hypothetical protein
MGIFRMPSLGADMEDGMGGRGYFLLEDRSAYILPSRTSTTYKFNWSYDFVIQSGE